ncbi:hypothetical protein CIG19_11325 [Enterobacterales bacterium CwR94]|nr:hypothetical protein CIG19_11325 [Enterobacterales bacterium CwR94]
MQQPLLQVDTAKYAKRYIERRNAIMEAIFQAEKRGLGEKIFITPDGKITLKMETDRPPE